jgi:hypothetical protein
MRKNVAALALLPLSAGCGKKDDAVRVAPSATALAVSSASWTGPDGALDGSLHGAATHFAIDPTSTSHIDMPGDVEHLVADTTAAAGTLDVVLTDLGQTRGLVRIDLATLTTSTFHNAHDADQTKHARTWLEAVVDGKTNEAMRWADFAIRSVDGLSATDVSKVPAAKDGADEVRRVSAVVHGDLLVHGHQVARDDAVEVTFRYPAGAPADGKPARVEIKSTRAMHVVLKEHAVEPRDPVGTVLGWTDQLLSKVARTADVTVSLAAIPAP